MLRLRDKTPHVEFKGVVEIDELYVNAGLKVRSNRTRIKLLSRKPRHRAFRKHGRGLWMYDKPAIFILVNRNGEEDYVTSSNVESEAALKIISRRSKRFNNIY